MKIMHNTFSANSETGLVHELNHLPNLDTWHYHTTIVVANNGAVFIDNTVEHLIKFNEQVSPGLSIFS